MQFPAILLVALGIFATQTSRVVAPLPAQVVVSQSYGKAERVKLPLDVAARRVLSYCKIHNLPRSGTYTLRLDVRGEPVARVFDKNSMGHDVKPITLYAGVSLSGRISLHGQDTTSIYEETFAERYVSRWSAADRADPSSAPFQEVLETSNFASALVEILRKWCGQDAVMDVLRDSIPYLRRGAVQVLGRLDRDIVVAPLIRALRTDRSIAVRGEAATVLGQMKEPRALPALIEALTNEENFVNGGDLLEPLQEDVAGLAAMALGAIGDRRAIRPLIDAWDKSSIQATSSIDYALRQLTGSRPSGGVTISGHGPHWRKWLEENKDLLPPPLP